MLLAVFNVDFVPKLNTLAKISFPYSCITATRSDSLSIILATISLFLLSNAVKIAGNAAEDALGLNLNHLIINVSDMVLIFPLNELM